MAPKKDANAGGDGASEEISADAVRKMKVGDLRSALEARGLDSKGLKADLVERLLEATGQVGEGYAEKEEERDRRRKGKSRHWLILPFCSLQLRPHFLTSNPNRGHTNEHRQEKPLRKQEAKTRAPTRQTAVEEAKTMMSPPSQTQTTTTAAGTRTAATLQPPLRPRPWPSRR